MLTGSILSLSLNSIPFNVIGEADPTLKPSYETTMTTTSGGSIPSREKKNPDIESVTLDTSDHSDYESLVGIIEGGVSISASMTLASGQVLSSGATWISLGDKGFMKGQTEVTLHPENGWLKS